MVSLWFQTVKTHRSADMTVQRYFPPSQRTTGRSVFLTIRFPKILFNRGLAMLTVNQNRVDKVKVNKSSSYFRKTKFRKRWFISKHVTDYLFRVSVCVNFEVSNRRFVQTSCARRWSNAVRKDSLVALTDLSTRSTAFVYLCSHTILILLRMVRKKRNKPASNNQLKSGLNYQI